MKNSIVLAVVLAVVLAPVFADAVEVLVQTKANASNAAAGDQGATIESSALITVVVTKFGKPVTNLGTDTGDGTAAITLPDAWTFDDGFNVPPAGCLMTLTQFVNDGNGVYSIRVVPSVDNLACAWLSGDYHYAVSVLSNGRRGTGLGVLTIP